MRSPFNPIYHANFCAECGNRIEPHSTGTTSYFWPRYFCNDCAGRFKQRRLITPLTGLLLIASLAIFAFSYKRENAPPRQVIPPVSDVPVSAQDSIVNPTSKLRVENKERVLCGAKTRRGTPCRHVVQPGQRCAQHQGLPSMLDNAMGPR
ncbi:MAG: hypothetical protein M3X11_23880 [Acidobacteriota bacterium]|nr:hypothetical protein [Acidobacteriota bacterium]